MIIAVVDPKGVDFGGETIKLLNEERSLLAPEKYTQLADEINPYWLSSQQLFIKPTTET